VLTHRADEEPLSQIVLRLTSLCLGSEVPISVTGGEYERRKRARLKNFVLVAGRGTKSPCLHRSGEKEMMEERRERKQQRRCGLFNQSGDC